MSLRRMFIRAVWTGPSLSACRVTWYCVTYVCVRNAFIIFISWLLPLLRQSQQTTNWVYVSYFSQKIDFDISYKLSYYFREWSKKTFEYMVELAYSPIAKHVGASIVSGYQFSYQKEASLYNMLWVLIKSAEALMGTCTCNMIFFFLFIYFFFFFFFFVVVVFCFFFFFCFFYYCRWGASDENSQHIYCRERGKLSQNCHQPILV